MDIGPDLPIYHAIGSQGSWSVKINGKSVSCAWEEHCDKSNGTYCDTGFISGDRKWDAYVSLIQKEMLVALTARKKDTDGSTWKRDGYIGLYRVKNVEVTSKGLEFEFDEALARLKRPSQKS